MLYESDGWVNKKWHKWFDCGIWQEGVVSFQKVAFGELHIVYDQYPG